ncbi:MAG: hypothetical protein KKF65_00315 [Nanoarchaeota archaeon]|nr:hypothetical protein [Nanoarchaeota archaeon]
MLLILLLFIPIVNGLGVAQDFLQDDTLKLLKGETHYFKLILQNSEDIQVFVKVEVESEIAEIEDEKELYELSPKSYHNEVFLKITSPKNAKLGDSYKVSYAVTPVVKQEGGQIGMNMRIRQSFDVVIVDEDGVGYNKYVLRKSSEQKPSSFGTIKKIFPLILLIIIIGAVGTLIVRKSALISKKILLKNKPKQITNKEETLVQEKRIEEDSEKSTAEEKPIIQKLVSEKEEKELLFDKEAPSQDKYFHFNNETVLKSVNDLYYYLKVMPEGTYYYHVSEHHNHFADWIQGVFQYNDLAEKIRHCRTREEMRRILEDEQK